jgi:hypothetical protein
MWVLQKLKGLGWDLVEEDLPNNYPHPLRLLLLQIFRSSEFEQFKNQPTTRDLYGSALFANFRKQIARLILRKVLSQSDLAMIGKALPQVESARH